LDILGLLLMTLKPRHTPPGLSLFRRYDRSPSALASGAHHTTAQHPGGAGHDPRQALAEPVANIIQPRLTALIFLAIVQKCRSEPPACGSPRRPCQWHRCSLSGEIDGPVWSVSDRGTAGAFRSSGADRGAQVLPPAGATVPPWLPGKSARVSNLRACCARGPPACAAPCSCRREPCNGRSAWLPLGRACLSAWIEHRSGEQRSP
jgi:hypothetical protein